MKRNDLTLYAITVFGVVAFFLLIQKMSAKDGEKGWKEEPSNELMDFVK